jgi:hypothetical protein
LSARARGSQEKRMSLSNAAPISALAPRLSPALMGDLVDGYFRDLDRRPWNRFHDFDWSQLAPETLSEDQRSALSFITYIEDHIPGYFIEYNRLFPVDGSVGREDFAHHRELYRFSVKWAQEEEAHAHLLFAYQVKAGLADADQLRLQLADEGRKPFHLAGVDPIQVFTYTLVQEKATQLFYQRFARAVDEPVLRAILQTLTRDEARHFAFFARVVQAYLSSFGEAMLGPMQEVLRQFKMPLSETLRGYWRWSLRISDAVGGYDHAEAYADLVRVVESTENAASWSRTRDLRSMVDAILKLSPVAVQS